MHDLDPIFLESRITELEKNSGGGAEIDELKEAVKELEEATEEVDNSLSVIVGHTDTHFYFDYQNNEFGYNINKNRGANSFTPFAGRNYRGLEHIVGTWLDGEPIYERTIKGTTQGAGENNIATINASKVIYIEGYCYESNGNVAFFNSYPNSVNYSHYIFYNVDDHKLKMGVPSAGAHQEFAVTVRYLK